MTAVEMMVYALNQGHRVVSNVKLRNLGPQSRLRYTYIEDIFDYEFDDLPQGAPRGSGFPDRVIVCLDEVAEAFDQYSGQKASRFLSWLRHSSKRGQTVILIVQMPEFLQKSLRKLVYRWIFCEDMATFRLPVLRCRIPFTSHLCRRMYYDRMGNPITRSPWNFVVKRQLGKYYDTAQSIAHLKLDDFHSTIEITPPGVVWFRRAVLLLLVLELVAVCLK